MESQGAGPGGSGSCCCDSFKGANPIELIRTGEALISAGETMMAWEAASPIDYPDPSYHLQPPKRYSASQARDIPDRYLADMAAKILKGQRGRAKYFEDDIFGDPAWHMLLDLFVHTVRHTRVSVTSLCIAADVPPTTALRWTTVLEKRELILRTPFEEDKRSYSIDLTDKGLKLMRRCLTDWIKNMGLHR